LRGFILKAAATAVTVAMTVSSALYVTVHMRNPAAPLRPAVLASGRSQSVSVLGSSVTVGPSVQPTAQAPITSTYAS